MELPNYNDHFEFIYFSFLVVKFYMSFEMIVLLFFCSRFKVKDGIEMKNKKEELRWELLVKKVILAKATSSLLLTKRKRKEEHEPTPSCGEGNVNHDYVIRNLVC